MAGLEWLEPQWLVFAVILGFLLLVSFRSRARVFCQYLRLMTGIELTPKEVKNVHRLRGKEGVRELLIDLLIQKDLESGPLSPEDAEPTKPASSLGDG